MAIGLDIGGANLKAATGDGHAVSRRFELWKYPDRLADELRELSNSLPADDRIGVTMTGELCDCFPTKRDGVDAILAAVQEVFPGRARVWSTAGLFLSIAQAWDEWLSVAAANWHAQATFVARLVPEGPALLLDCGSTTTDIVPILDGRPVPAALTDTDRLACGELVYTGARRTPICALLASRVAAEFFATSQDAFLLLDLIEEDATDIGTADGRPATKACAHARMARMLGGDADTTDWTATRHLAHLAFTQQCLLISRGIAQACKRLPQRPNVVLLSGSGDVLGQAAARSAGDVAIRSLSAEWGRDRSDSACAYAVARLAAES